MCGHGQIRTSKADGSVSLSQTQQYTCVTIRKIIQMKFVCTFYKHTAWADFECTVKFYLCNRYSTEISSDGHLQICKPECTCTCLHTNTHAHAHTHAHACTHTHTHRRNATQHNVAQHTCTHRQIMCNIFIQLYLPFENST